MENTITVYVLSNGGLINDEQCTSSRLSLRFRKTFSSPTFSGVFPVLVCDVQSSAWQEGV